MTTVQHDWAAVEMGLEADYAPDLDLDYEPTAADWADYAEFLREREFAEFEDRVDALERIRLEKVSDAHAAVGRVRGVASGLQVLGLDREAAALLLSAADMLTVLNLL